MRLLIALVALAVAAAFTGVGARILVTGELPREDRAEPPDGALNAATPKSNPRAVGGTAVGMGIVAGLFGLALLHARARQRKEWRIDQVAAARMGLDPRAVARPRSSVAWQPIALTGAGLALLAARFGDDVARHVDAEALRATRSLDGAATGSVEDALGARLRGARATTEEDFFEDVLETAGLLLDTNDVREAYELVRSGSGDDLHFHARIALTETREVYRRITADVYELVEQRHVRHTSVAIDGVVLSTEVVEDQEPLDAARGESSILRFLTRRVDPDGREVAEVAFEHRAALGAEGSAFVYTIPNEVEAVSAVWDEARSTSVVTLRTTPAGRARAAGALAAATRDMIAPALTAEHLGGRELALDVPVPTVAEATLSLAGDTLELLAPGATVLDMIGVGKR